MVVQLILNVRLEISVALDDRYVVTESLRYIALCTAGVARPLVNYGVTAGTSRRRLRDTMVIEGSSVEDQAGYAGAGNAGHVEFGVGEDHHDQKEEIGQFYE